MTYSQLTYPKAYAQRAVVAPTNTIQATWNKHKGTIGDFITAALLLSLPMLLLFI